MITRYLDFIKENTNNGSYTVSDPEYYGITNYEWVNGKLNVNQDVKISGMYHLTKLPFPFGTIKGDFDCKDNKLTTLENSPTKVYGSFDCENNLLDSLYGSPEYVQGNFCFSGNDKIRSFDHCPKEVGYMNCPVYLVDEHPGQKIENYPLCIINSPENFDYSTFRIDNVRIFAAICYNVYNFKDKFRPLLNDKMAFLLMVIEVRPVIIPYFTPFLDKLPIEDFPRIVPTKKDLFRNCKHEFKEIGELLYDNPAVFEPLLDNKVRFHQQVIRMRPDLIKYYTTISPPPKRTII